MVFYERNVAAINFGRAPLDRDGLLVSVVLLLFWQLFIRPIVKYDYFLAAVRKRAFIPLGWIYQYCHYKEDDYYTALLSATALPQSFIQNELSVLNFWLISPT